jgi:lipopolysaccharide export system protein LptA
MTRRVMILAVIAAPLAAQSALKGHNTDAPIDVDAKAIDVLDANGKAIWTGDVRVTQGTMKLNADTITVFYSRSKKGGNPTIERLDAQNNVKLVTPSETATGRYGIYDVAQKTITLVGGVVLTKGENILHGQRLSIDLDSGRSKLDGAGTPAAPGQPATTGGRVTGRFVVPPRTPAK